MQHSDSPAFFNHLTQNLFLTTVLKRAQLEDGHPCDAAVGHPARAIGEHYELAGELLLQVLLVSCAVVAAVVLCGC